MKEKEAVIATIRILLTWLLLTFVWLNSHWSVALVLTLLSIRIEIGIEEDTGLKTKA